MLYDASECALSNCLPAKIKRCWSGGMPNFFSIPSLRTSVVMDSLTMNVYVPPIALLTKIWTREWRLSHCFNVVVVKVDSNLKIFMQIQLMSLLKLFAVIENDLISLIKYFTCYWIKITSVLPFSEHFAEIHRWMVDPVHRTVDVSCSMIRTILFQWNPTCDSVPSSNLSSSPCLCRRSVWAIKSKIYEFPIGFGNENSKYSIVFFQCQKLPSNTDLFTSSQLKNVKQLCTVRSPRE